MAYYPPRIQDDIDPLDHEKIPSLSWRALPVGTVFTCEVLEQAKQLQSRDYDTNKPKFWNDDPTQGPVMAAVINVRVIAGPHSVGEKRSIWAQIPSSLFVALREAQKTAGQRIGPGGTLHIRFVAETPHVKPKNNPIKQYEARYEPPAASDAFADTPPAQPPQYAQPARTAQPARPATSAPTEKPKGW